MSNNLGDGQHTDCTGIIHISENLSGFFFFWKLISKVILTFGMV